MSKKQIPPPQDAQERNLRVGMTVFVIVSEDENSDVNRARQVLVMKCGKRLRDGFE